MLFSTSRSSGYPSPNREGASLIAPTPRWYGPRTRVHGIPRRALSSPDGEDSQTTAIFISKRLLGNRKKLLGAPERACLSYFAYCHGTGAACFAYGAGAFDGDVIKGTTDPTQYRTTVRTSKKDSHDQGINRSCDYRWQSADCRCDTAWAGGQADRVIWSSGSAKSTPPPEQDTR